jgi:hypothetical protein
MRPSRGLAALLVSALLATLAACSGDDDDASSTTSASSARSDAAEQIVAVCEDLDDALAARGPFPVEGFDPDAPDPAQLPAVADYFEGAVPLAEDALERIRSVPVPTVQQADLDTFVAALEEELTNTRAQIDAARAQDVAAFTATLPRTEEIVGRQLDAAEALGVEACAS